MHVSTRKAFSKAGPRHGALLASAVSAAQAQTGYPNRAITMVLPLPAGGTADLLCRFAADKASGSLGQQVVVENRPGGAGGRIGTEQVMRSPPDGYTLLCAPQLTFSITHLVFTKAAFDTRAMEPVSVLATYPLILIGRAGGAVQHHRRARRLCARQSRQGQLWASGQGQYRPFARRAADAQGRFPHDRNSLSRQRSGHQRSVRRQYRPGAGLSARQQAEHRCRQAEISRHRQPRATQGLSRMSRPSPRRCPGVYADTWMAVAAPAGTPKEITTKVSDAIGQGFRQPDLKARILALEAEPLGSTPRADARHDPAKPGDLGTGGRGRQDQRRMSGAIAARGKLDRSRLMRSEPVVASSGIAQSLCAMPAVAAAGLALAAVAGGGADARRRRIIRRVRSRSSCRSPPAALPT